MANVIVQTKVRAAFSLARLRGLFMHFEPRLWVFTKGVRLRITSAVAVGLISVACGIARLASLAWLIGAVFEGRPVVELAMPIAAVAVLMMLRGALEYARTMIAHRTAHRVQVRL